MTPRSTLIPWFALAAFAACGSIVLAQPAPAQPAPAQPAATASAATTATAPIERRSAPNIGMRPGMRPGGMHPGVRPNLMQDRRNGPGNIRGGFHGPQDGSMETSFHIAPAGLWWRNPMVVQRLTLTPEQVKRMDGIFQQSRLELIDLKANVEKQNAMLEPLLSANPPDTAQATAQIDKVAEARAELEKSDAKMLLGIREVLTPDQWTKLSAHRGPGGFSGPGAGGYGAGRGPRNFIAPIRQP